MAEQKRPLALTEGRLTAQLTTLIDLHSTAQEREQGLSELALSRIQDAINRYLDQARCDLIAYRQQQQER